MKELDADADRISEPMVRRGEQWVAVSWEEAFAEIERGLARILQEHGRDAFAFYVGNPNVHNLSNLLYLPMLLHAGGTRIFSRPPRLTRCPSN